MGYIERMRLTDKGKFAAKIYADELLFGEAFATEFWTRLSPYQIFLLIATICYEWRESDLFHHTYPTDESHKLKQLLLRNEFFQRDRRFKEIDALTAIIQPCYLGKSIFDIIDNTTLLEGDLIRYFRQILDRIGQLKHATEDADLVDRLDHIKEKITTTIKDIDVL